jgi:hypothetical protein
VHVATSTGGEVVGDEAIVFTYCSAHLYFVLLPSWQCLPLGVGCCFPYYLIGWCVFGGRGSMHRVLSARHLISLQVSEVGSVG